MPSRDNNDTCATRYREMSEISHDAIITICRNNVPNWEQYSLSDFRVEDVLGGLTNSNFCISLHTKHTNATLLHGTRKAMGAAQHQEEINSCPSITRDSVFFRQYGAASDLLFSRELEIQIVKTLSKLGYCEFIAGDGDWRIEHWFAGSRVLRRDELPGFIEATANLIGAFHSLSLLNDFTKFPSDPAALIRLRSWGLEALQIMKYAEFQRVSKLHGSSMPTRLLLLAEGLHGLLKPRFFPIFDFPDLELEMNWLLSILQRFASSGQEEYAIVFCHNDIQENNILLKQDGDLELIDLEYGHFNFALYDVANYFLEFTIDYLQPLHKPYFLIENSSYPSLESMRLFFVTYLKRLERITSTTLSEEVDTLVLSYSRAAKVLGLVSHLQWGFWSFLKIDAEDGHVLEEDESFDHVVYAAARFSSYFKLKEELLASGHLQI